MAMTPKENYLTALVEHKKPEWVPSMFECTVSAGGVFETFENGPLGGGVDGFGVTWMSTISASGQPVPAPGVHLLEDITAWEDVVVFPDLDAFDWEGMAAEQLARLDRSAQVVEYGSWNGQFLRLTHLMGFENALISMITEPEATAALLGALTDHKIRVAERAWHYFKPDFFTSYDDVATETNLFMNPEIYRALVKPEHKRLNDAIRALGMLPIQHCCGKCESIIPDFIDEGAVCWAAAQPVNDIVGILKEHGGKLSVMGGYDSNGRPGLAQSTDEEVEEEVVRCINSYGPLGSYALFGFRLLESGDPTAFRKGATPIVQAWAKHRYEA